MKVLDHKIHKPPSNVAKGEFNAGEHLFVEIEEGKYQTISCRLPNGKYVTFAFIPSSIPGEMESVDLHTTVGKTWEDPTTMGGTHYEQHLVGFRPGGDTFDTRKIQQKTKKATSLSTLLLSKRHYD